MSQLHRDLARHWFEDVWNARRDATVQDLLAEKAVLHMEGGDFIGPDRFLETRALLLDAFPDIRLTVEDVVADGERAVVRWSAAAHHRGALFGIKPSGEEIRFRGMTWMIFRDGKVTEGWDSWNLGGLLNDLRTASAEKTSKPARAVPRAERERKATPKLGL
jgi:steroid delta-isomerase-like uncharacterized protein